MLDRVFRALADPERRKVLDLLRRKDGRTLQELCGHFDMSRFGVMKHLRVLEWANLVVPLKDGRWTRHYLNPVPIQQIADRWVARYRAPMARALSKLEERWEAKTRASSTRRSSARRSRKSGAPSPAWRRSKSFTTA